MLYYNPAQSLTVVSYDTLTFSDLDHMIKQEYPDLVLNRVEPEQLFAQAPDSGTQYINLVIRDLELRSQVTDYLNTNQCQRFSYVHPMSSICVKIDAQLGLYIGPFTFILTKSVLEKDLIFFGQISVGHAVHIKTGTVISGHVTVGGSSVIGKFCMIYIGTCIYNQITVADHTTIACGSIVQKSITKSGTYASKISSSLIKLDQPKG